MPSRRGLDDRTTLIAGNSATYEGVGQRAARAGDGLRSIHRSGGGRSGWVCDHQLGGAADDSSAAPPKSAGALQLGEALDEPLQGHRRLEPGQGGTEAVVNAGGEREVLRTFSAPEVKAVGIVVRSGVPVGAAR